MSEIALFPRLSCGRVWTRVPLPVHADETIRMAVRRFPCCRVVVARLPRHLSRRPPVLCSADSSDLDCDGDWRGPLGGIFLGCLWSDSGRFLVCNGAFRAV